MSDPKQGETENTFQALVEALREARHERGLNLFQIQEAIEEVLSKEEIETLKELL